MTDRKPRKFSTSIDDDERRAAPRHDAQHLGKIITRVIGGGEVRLLDFSRTGILLEMDARLAIGAKATIRLTTTDAALTVRGEVVRSKVAGMGASGGLVYQTALHLETDLTELEKAVPAPTVAAAPPADEKAPPFGAAEERLEPDDLDLAHLTSNLTFSMPTVRGDGSEHAADEELEAGVDANLDPILEFLATVPHDLAELKRRAAVNDW
jgi:hypothetical protein